MKALRYHARRDFRLEQVPEPAPGPGEVKVRVSYCGICGSDMHEYLAGLTSVPTTRPHPRTGKAAPLTGGHEFSGVVAELGEGVSQATAGARVTVRPTMPCYECDYCAQRRYVQCEKLATIGLAEDGGFAEFAVVPEDCLVYLPDHMSDQAGAFVEPLACGVHAVERSGMQPGDTAVVLGVGCIGIMVLQAALALGAGKVYVFETVPLRRELALQLGATDAFDPGEVDPGRTIAALTNKRRAEIAFECAGVPATMLLADDVTGRGSTIVAVGALVQPCEFPFINLFMREKSIVASQGYLNDEFETAARLIAEGKVQTEPLTTGIIALDDIVECGFEELAGDNRDSHCKILVTPGRGASDHG